MSTGPESKRILLVGEHTLCLEAVRVLLSHQAGYRVIGEALDVAAAVRIAGSETPSVVVASSGTCASGGKLVDIPALVAAFEGSAVVVVSCKDSEAEVLEALQAGVLGYVSTDSRLDVLIDAVERASNGEVALSPGLTSALLSHMRRVTQVGAPARGEEPDRLTEREIEIIRLIARGDTNQQVASALGISLSTVKNHLSSVFRKLDANSRSQVISEAIRRGVLEP